MEPHATHQNIGEGCSHAAWPGGESNQHAFVKWDLQITRSLTIFHAQSFASELSAGPSLYPFPC